MTLPIYQVDAFTNEVFKGNPAAVVPLRSWLPVETMQQLAMENNLAETVFFVPLPPDNDAGAHFHIRWFTPTLEIDLCGHATVAAAFVISKLLELGEDRLIFSTEKVGNLEVTVDGDWYLLDFPSRMPQPAEAPAVLLQALGHPAVVEVLKSRDYFVVLKDEASVAAVQPDMSLLKQLDGTGVIVTAPGDVADAVTRCFFPKAGVDEDPVTGSAHCNVVPYWSQRLGKKQLACRQISARGGVLVCEDRGERVILGGQAVLYMKGEFYLPE
ncbi:MAG: PhzF family phenazine biosynthesis protein [Chitinophagaceae bacterium]|nr:PhzF family phenazine biosynthesis protein [Chitinophagaceae bacterium]